MPVVFFLSKLTHTDVPVPDGLRPSVQDLVFVTGRVLTFDTYCTQVLQFLDVVSRRGSGIRGLTSLRSVHSQFLPSLSRTRQSTTNQGHTAQRVVVCRDRICHMGWVGIGVNDADGRHVECTALVQADGVLERVEVNNQIGTENS